MSAAKRAAIKDAMASSVPARWRRSDEEKQLLRCIEDASARAVDPLAGNPYMTPAQDLAVQLVVSLFTEAEQNERAVKAFEWSLRLFLSRRAGVEPLRKGFVRTRVTFLEPGTPPPKALLRKIRRRLAAGEAQATTNSSPRDGNQRSRARQK